MKKLTILTSILGTMFLISCASDKPAAVSTTTTTRETAVQPSATSTSTTTTHAGSRY